MEYFIYFLLIIAAIPIVFVGAVVAVGWDFLTRAGKMELRPLPEEEAASHLKRLLADGIIDSDWLEENGFEPAGVYRATELPGRPNLVGWKKVGERTYFCVYMFFLSEPIVQLEFMSVFGERTLTTGSSMSAQSTPPPRGSWQQTFSEPGASGLWRHHQAGLDYLAGKTGLRPDDEPSSFAEDLVAVTRRQVAHARSFLLWPLQIPRWYFVRRPAFHQKAIWEMPTEGTSANSQTALGWQGSSKPAPKR